MFLYLICHSRSSRDSALVVLRFFRSFGLKHSLLITFKPGPGAEPFSLVGSCELAWEGTLSRRNNTAMLDARRKSEYNGIG